jgi:cell division protein FtsL
MKFDGNMLKTYMLSILVTMAGFLVANYFSSFATLAEFNSIKSQVQGQQEDLKEIKQDVKFIRDILMGNNIPNPNR